MCVQLENDKFDVLFHSPLKRAAKTATIIWGSRPGKAVILPTLREIDLYSFQVAFSSHHTSPFRACCSEHQRVVSMHTTNRQHVIFRAC